MVLYFDQLANLPGKRWTCNQAADDMASRPSLRFHGTVNASCVLLGGKSTWSVSEVRAYSMTIYLPMHTFVKKEDPTAGKLMMGELRYALVLARCYFWLPSRVGPGGKAPSMRGNTPLLLRLSSVLTFFTKRKLGLSC